MASWTPEAQRARGPDRVLRVTRRRGHARPDLRVLALLHCDAIGSAHHVPFIVMNYDGCFDGLLQFLEKDMVEYGSLRDGELRPHWHACGTNDEALAYLADHAQRP